MFKTLCMKIFWIVMGICGVITVVLCVWMLTITVSVKRGTEEIKQIPSGHSPKIGLAAGALMIGTSIAACVMNIANHRFMLAVNIFAALALTVVCFAIALKDHIETQDQLHLQPIHLHDAYNRFLNRLKILGAFSGLDSFIEVVGLIIILAAHRERSSANVIQMNKRF